MQLKSSELFPGDSVVKNLHAMQEIQEMQFLCLDQEDPLEEEMATHSSITAWEMPWREAPGGLQSMGSQRVGHDLVNEHACMNPEKLPPGYLRSQGLQRKETQVLMSLDIG